MACSNCGPGGCQTRAITVTLFKKTWSASELAAIRQRQLMEDQNVLMREIVPPNENAEPGTKSNDGSGNGNGQQ